MNYLLDTNVISELQNPNCNEKVRAFIKSIRADELFLCTVTIGEICYGIERLPNGEKKHNLTLWLYSKVLEYFKRRIIPLDTDLMLEWGRIRAKAGRTLPFADALIASVALSRNMILVTRNIKDFEDIPGIKLLDPWQL